VHQIISDERNFFIIDCSACDRRNHLPQPNAFVQALFKAPPQVDFWSDIDVGVCTQS